MTVTYIRGEDNTVATALSRLPMNCFQDEQQQSVAAVLSIATDLSYLTKSNLAISKTNSVNESRCLVWKVGQLPTGLVH